MQGPFSAFQRQLEARRAHTGVHLLAELEPGGRYEACLVFGLGQDGIDVVERLRQDLPCQPPLEHTLAPHLTVLYLGRWTSARLAPLLDATKALESSPLRVETEGLGMFLGDSKIHNVHLRVTNPAAIRSLHHRALDTLGQAGWSPQTPFVGQSYVPHISIFDKLDAPLSLRSTIESWPTPRWTGELHELCVMGKLLELS